MGRGSGLHAHTGQNYLVVHKVVAPRRLHIILGDARPKSHMGSCKCRSGDGREYAIVRGWCTAIGACSAILTVVDADVQTHDRACDLSHLLIDNQATGEPRG